MWGSFLDKGKELAAQAKRAAEELDKHLNESSGIAVVVPSQQHQQVDSSSGASNNDDNGSERLLADNDDDDDDDDDDVLNDAWEEDDDEAIAVAAATTGDCAAAASPPLDSRNKEGASAEEEAPKEEEEADEGANIEEPPNNNAQEGWGGDEVEEDVEFDEVQLTGDELAATTTPESENGTEDEAHFINNNSATTTEAANIVAEGAAAVESESVEENAARISAPLFCGQAAPGSEETVPETAGDDAPPVEGTAEEEVAGQGGREEVAVVDFVPEEPQISSPAVPAFSSLFGSLAQLAQQQPLFSADSRDEAENLEEVGSAIVEVEEESFEQHEVEPNVEETLEEPEPPTEAPEEATAVEESSEASQKAVESAPQPQESDLSLAVCQKGVSAAAVAAAAESLLSPQQSSSDGQVARFIEQQTDYTRIMEAKMEEMQHRLSQREEQLLSKTEQLTMMEAMHETEKQDLLLKVQSTKEEAKRRIQKAKERVDAVEQKLKNVTAAQSSTAEDAGKQAEMIAALREEGTKLARKQADMEAAVRSAKGETRELLAQLEETQDANEQAQAKIAILEADLKSTRDDLTWARQGESQAGKLDSDLRNVREESERRAATILTLQQEVKELKSTQKELRKELQETRKGAAVETEQERKKLLTERNHLVSDLEAKLRSSEREAGVREDALRHEVDELRKRWQDAVRRADSLSVDVQSSTAPLLRQLESTNKQNRARAAAWAELETQLRTELEENVILNEKLSKERNEWKTKGTRLERLTKDYETELKQLKGDFHDKREKVQKLEHKLEEMEAEGAKMKAEWAEVERLANEGVSRVRSEMTRTVVEADERHRAQIESLEARLRIEREQRSHLEQQLQGLLDNAGMFVPAADSDTQSLSVVKEVAPKKLRQSQGQAEILAGALGGLGGDDEHSDGDDDDENDVPNGGAGTGSFAALEQLTSRLKASKVELTTLRTRLAESETTRGELVQVLAESRNAREKLPLFESRVHELTAENRELTLEVQGLREDISDVRELYRTQLNVLLEAQAANYPRSNGNSSNGSTEQTDAPYGKAHHDDGAEVPPEESSEVEVKSDASNGVAAPEIEDSN